MKICPECGRTQSKGDYCLDDGSRLKEEARRKECKFKAINTSRSTDTLKADIRNWLTRIGVVNPDIKIKAEGYVAKVTYVLEKKEYCFTSEHQRDYRSNLAAVEQFLHYRVLSIERGIETLEGAFKGYEALEYTDHFGGCRNSTEVISRYKELAKELHPDKGGDPGAFQSMKSAYELKLKEVEE